MPKINVQGDYFLPIMSDSILIVTKKINIAVCRCSLLIAMQKIEIAVTF